MIVETDKWAPTIVKSMSAALMIAMSMFDRANTLLVIYWRFQTQDNSPTVLERKATKLFISRTLEFP